jgi:predicted lipid-binding transport protein (Tim44 family)
LGHALLGTLYGSRALGWALIGAGIGAAEGLYERSGMMVRRGAMAGALGGLAGGFLYGEVFSRVSRFSDAGSRAVAFSLFGSCVGASIGLAETAFARAWPIRKRRSASDKKNVGQLLSPEPGAQAKPNPGAAKPARPTVTNAAKRQPTGMTPCPKCKRPVPGTRPYCVFCKISF